MHLLIVIFLAVLNSNTNEGLGCYAPEIIVPVTQERWFTFPSGE
jgi:hypothetical protein